MSKPARKAERPANTSFWQLRVRPSGVGQPTPRSTPLNNEPRRDPRQGIRKTRGRFGPASPRSRARAPGSVPPPGENTKRLSTTDISALASMKNVAKCDTWCELQNPVNHRVFERKLRPKPSGRGHVCLGVTHRVAPPCAPCARGSGYWSPVPPAGAVGSKRSPRRRTHDKWWFLKGPSRPVVRTSCFGVGSRDPYAPSVPRDGASTATPGQAGLPAEFKHINKRRKRNLQGFP